MLRRTLVALLVLFSGNLFSQQPTVFSRQEQTGVIVFEMSGDLARKYAQISGATDGNEGLSGDSISTTAFIAQRLENGQVQIEHIATVKKDERPDRLVTLTTTVDKAAIRSLVRTVFEGEFTFSGTPAAEKSSESPTVRARHLPIPFLSLTELRGVKIRSWKLESEIGK